MASPDVLRAGVARLTARAAIDAGKILTKVTDPVVAREALTDVLPALIDTYGAAAASFAADWYSRNRDEAGVRGKFRAEPVSLSATGGRQLAAYAVGPLFGDEPNMARTRVMLNGGLQRRIANAARQTVMTSSIQDPFAKGWQRAGSGECAFCAMLVGRGAVYSESSADFSSHDHCACAAVPAFDGLPRPVKSYTPSARRVTDADRSRIREYLRTQ